MVTMITMHGEALADLQYCDQSRCPSCYIIGYSNRQIDSTASYPSIRRQNFLKVFLN
jgi:hypothetical protein